MVVASTPTGGIPAEGTREAAGLSSPHLAPLIPVLAPLSCTRLPRRSCHALVNRGSKIAAQDID